MPALAQAAWDPTQRHYDVPGSDFLTAMVIDPCPDQVHGVQDEMRDHGIGLAVCTNGAQALLQAGRLHPGLVIMRAMDTEIPAVVVVETLCAESIPVAVAVGLGEADRVRALFDAGASRLISYPYLATEVSTLVSQHFPEAERRRAEQAVLAVDDVELNGPAFEVRVSGHIVALPLREFELLRFFMLHADQVVTEDQIRAAVWGSRGYAATTKTIALHVRRLRERIGDSVELVRVRGVGYRLKVVHGTDA